MKRYRLIITTLFTMLLFAAVGSMFVNADVHQLMADPINFVTQNFNPAGVSIATFSAAALLWEDGTENMGGFRNYLYLIPISHIATEAELVDNPTTDAEHVTLVGSHVLVAGKYWKKIYATPNTIKLTPEPQGEIDGQSFKPKGELFSPGSGDAVNALARQVNNGNFVLVLVEENGRRIQVGSKGHPARLKPSPDMGMAAADRKGFKFEFESDSYVAILRYNGEIVLSETETEPAIS